MYEQCGFFPRFHARRTAIACSTIYSGFQERETAFGSTIETLESAQMREKKNRADPALTYGALRDAMAGVSS